MLLDLLASVTLFRALFQLDLQFAQEWRERGCPFCKAPLHFARYRRKPRGGPGELPEEYCWRQSLCCSRDGCRRRTLPASCLFMGRRVYLMAALVAACTLLQKRPPESTVRELTAALGVSRRTLKRWLDWFATIYPRRDEWQRLRGLVDASVLESDLPAGLLARFQESIAEPLKAFAGCLHFMASGHKPLTKHNK